MEQTRKYSSSLKNRQLFKSDNREAKIIDLVKFNMKYFIKDNLLKDSVIKPNVENVYQEV